MRNSIWPAIRTGGIALIVAILAATYTQVLSDAHEKDNKLQTISNQIADLKIIIMPQIATLVEKDIELDRRLSQLEIYQTSSKR